MNQKAKSIQEEALRPSDVLQNVIGFSNKWMSLIWAVIYSYVSFNNEEAQDYQCERLEFPTRIQSYLYIFQFISGLCSQEEISGRFQSHFKQAKHWICYLNLLLACFNVYIAFTTDQQTCKYLNSLNRLHGLFLFIFDIFGLLFALLVFGQKMAIEKHMNKNKRY